MIKVGGNSYNNGIRFVGDRYNVSFETRNGSTNIYLRKNGANRTNRYMQVLEKIPFVRGIISIIFSNKIWLAVLIADIVLNMIIVPEAPTESVNMIMPIAVILIFALILNCLVLIYLVSKIFRKMRCTWQYHGAEHKVIYTNYDGRDITLENCRVSPRVNDNCGTMLVSLILTIWAILKVILIVFNVQVWSALEMVIVIPIAYELFLMKRNTPVLSCAFKIGYWLQKYLFTREPTDEQLSQAIEAFKLLEKAETNQIPSDELKELLENGKHIGLLNKLI